MAWLGTWANRFPIVIDHTKLTATVADFPVLLYLSAASGLSAKDVSAVFTNLGANSLKIAVALSDGTTQCYVEIDKWDNANNKAWIWTKISSISSSTDTTIYFYYDNNQSDNTTYVGVTTSTPAKSVWDANFLYVSHMSDGADTSHTYDSTANGYSGVKEAAAHPAVTTTSKVGNAQNFNGSVDYVDLGNVLDFNYADARTIEAWTYFSSIPAGEASVLGKQVIAAPYNGWTLDSTASGKLRFQYINNYPTHYWFQTTNSVILAATTWYYLASVYAGSGSLLIYQNASSKTLAAASSVSPSDVSTIKTLQIGIRDTSSNPFSGIMDEVRISNIARPAAYVTATYNTCLDGFGTWGTLETLANVYTKSASPLLGILPSRAKLIVIGRSYKPLLGELPSKKSGISKNPFAALLGIKSVILKGSSRVKSLLLGIKAVNNRQLAKLSIQKSLLGLKNSFSRIVSAMKEYLLLLGILSSRVRSSVYGRAMSNLLGLKTIFAKSLSILYFFASKIGLYSVAEILRNYFRIFVNLLGTKVSEAKNIVMQRLVKSVIGILSVVKNGFGKVFSTLLGLYITFAGKIVYLREIVNNLGLLVVSAIGNVHVYAKNISTLIGLGVNNLRNISIDRILSTLQYLYAAISKQSGAVVNHFTALFASFVGLFTGTNYSGIGTSLLGDAVTQQRRFDIFRDTLSKMGMAANIISFLNQVAYYFNVIVGITANYFRNISVIKSIVTNVGIFAAIIFSGQYIRRFLNLLGIKSASFRLLAVRRAENVLASIKAAMDRQIAADRINSILADLNANSAKATGYFRSVANALGLVVTNVIGTLNHYAEILLSLLGQYSKVARIISVNRWLLPLVEIKSALFRAINTFRKNNVLLGLYSAATRRLSAFRFNAVKIGVLAAISSFRKYVRQFVNLLGLKIAIVTGTISHYIQILSAAIGLAIARSRLIVASRKIIDLLGIKANSFRQFYLARYENVKEGIISTFAKSKFMSRILKSAIGIMAVLSRLVSLLRKNIIKLFVLSLFFGKIPIIYSKIISVSLTISGKITRVFTHIGKRTMLFINTGKNMLFLAGKRTLRFFR